MKIVVCIKHVGCIYHPSAMDLNAGDIDTAKMVFMLNPYDEVAVEAALRIQADVGDVQIVLITAGGPDAQSALRAAAAMGGARIDQLIRVDADTGLVPDAWQTSLRLAEVIRPMGADLILCGKKAIDTNGCQVGAFIADHLGLPQVSGIVDLKLAVSDRRVELRRAMGRGDTLEAGCDLPVLLTVDLGLNEPRYPTMPDRFFAARMPITVVAPGSAGSAAALVSPAAFSFPRPKTRKVFTPDSKLSVMDRMNAMLTGGGVKKESGSVLDGSDDELAGYLCDFLRENGILATDKK